MTQYARCGIYERRPQFCRDYPRPGDPRPASCTFQFVGEERTGSCQPEVCQEEACCNWPRRDGEPEGEAMTRTEGGRPCRHLRWGDVPETKTASGEVEYDPAEAHDLFFAGVVTREHR